jgi:hypothetical protein
MSEPEPRFTPSEVLDLLESAPARIEAATSGIPADDLIAPLEPGGWSARDILGHVRACDRTWGGYVARILDEDHPAFHAESPRSTIRRTDFLALPFGTSLEAFVDDRAQLVARLRGLDGAALARSATVTLPGRGEEERSIAYYADRLAEHEREHLLHLERMMAARRA